MGTLANSEDPDEIPHKGSYFSKHETFFPYFEKVGSDVLTVCSFKKESTVKPVLSSHSQIGKTNVLKTNGSLMKVESIAECSLGAFCNTFDLH